MFSPKNDFQPETVDVYIHENPEKENFSASSGIQTTQDLSAEN